MKPFGLYSDIEPALGRADVYLALTNYSAEPEPYRDLLHFPIIEQVLVPTLARRVAKLELASRIIPRLINHGLHEDRFFLAFTLGPRSTAPVLSLLKRPAPSSFWAKLKDGLKELHAAGFTYGHLREDTVAITDRGTPLLFDVTRLRSLGAQPPEVDFAATEALRERFGSEAP